MEAHRRALLFIAAIVWPSGCAVGPDYEMPAVAVPAAFGTAALRPAAAGGPPTADFVRWWQVMRDPQLESLIARAVAGSPDIELALTRVQEARAQQIVVLGGVLPEAGAAATWTAGTGPFPVIGRIPLPLLAGVDARGAQQVNRVAGFDASWEIDLFGKGRRALAAARDDADAQMEQRNAVLITVVADVARAYFNIRTLQMRMDIARHDIAIARRTVDLAVEKLRHRPADGGDGAPSKPVPKARREDAASPNRDNPPRDGGRPATDEKSSKDGGKSGDKALANEMNLAVAKGEVGTQTARLAELAAAIAAAESRLAVLLGVYTADIDGAVRAPALPPPLPERLRPGVPVDLLRRRPDIRAAERRLAASVERIGVKTASLFPSVTLMAGFGAQGTWGEDPGTAPPQGLIWTAGPRVYWPLLDFGRLDALIDIQEMQSHEELVRYRKTVIAAVDEVDLAIRQYHLDLQRWKTLAAALKEYRRGLKFAAEQYQRGDLDLLALLYAQRYYYLHEEQTAIAAENAVLSYIAFYKTLGGGWELYADLPPLAAAQPAVVAGVRRLSATGARWR
jgi:outer membrane protein TolC